MCGIPINLVICSGDRMLKTKHFDSFTSYLIEEKDHEYLN